MNIMPAARKFERSLDFESIGETQAFLLKALEVSADCVKVIDSSGFIRYASGTDRHAMDVREPMALEGLSWASLWPDSERESITAAVAVALLGETVRFEAPRVTPAGQSIWWNVTVAPLDIEVGGEPSVIAVMRAVSAASQGDALQRLVEQKDRELAEKDLLIHEIHHRSKNSLQLVQGLIGIQSRAAGTSPETRDQLTQSTARVRTIAALHDRLYRSKAGLEVEVRPYLESLVGDIQTGLANALSGRRVVFAADEATWAANDVPALGLVLTELMTNAVRHGQGDISVTFRQPAEGHGIVTVCDQGNRLPDGFNPSVNPGLGMKLVTTLLQERSGGSLEYSCEDGVTRFVAIMPAAAVHVAS